MQNKNLHKPDACLATAIETAVRDFGEGILDEQRLIGILKDFHGFETMPFAEHIVRTLINRHSLIQLRSLCKKGKDEIQADICRKSSILSKEYGYSEEKATQTILSVLFGLGCEVSYEVPDLDKKDPENRKKPEDRKVPDTSISIKAYNPPRKESTNPQNSKTSNTQSNQKRTFIFAFSLIMVAALMVVGFCLFLTFHQPNESIEEPITEIEGKPLPPLRSEREILDSIHREIDSTRKANGMPPLFYTSPKNGYPKGRYRESRDAIYETAYEEGYEDGLHDQRFK